MAKKTHSTKKKAVSVKPNKTRSSQPSMPKPIGFTKDVLRVLRHEKRLLGLLFLVTTLIALVMFGATQQDQYVATTTALNEYASEMAGKGFDAVTRFGVLVTTAATGGFNTTMSETQKVYFTLLYVLISLTTVWLLRHRMADINVTLRDGLYNAGAPMVAIVALFFVGVLQLLPMALGIIIYSAAVTSGLAHGVLETTLFVLLALVLSIASLYWLTSTIIALMIATNPGTYPLSALRAAKKVVAGRRTRLMVHFIWLALLLIVLWVAVLIPATLLDGWVNLSFLPIVVLSIQLLTSFSVIFTSVYIYLLYRKMIDEPAK